MYSRPTAPLSIGGVLDDGVKLYRATYARVWPIALICALLRTFSEGYTRVVAFSSGLGLQTMAAYRSPQVDVVSIIAGFVTIALMGALVVSQASLSAAGEQLSTGQALAAGFRRWGRGILAAILFGFAVAGGFVLLIIPGLYLLGALYLWYVPLFAENAGAMESLKISYRLIKGHWWRSATILTIAGIIFFVFAVIQGVVAGFTMVLTGGRAFGFIIAVVLAEFVVIVLFYPFFTALLISIYRDLQLRRQGGDLAARANTLQTA